MDTQPKQDGGAKHIVGIVIVGMVLGIFVIVGIAGFFAVKYVVERQQADTKKAEPMSEDELIKAQEQGEQAAGEIPRIIACFTTDDEYIRMQAAETLGKIGAKAVDPVRGLLKSADANVRYYAALSLALIGPDAAPAADDLVTVLGDSDPRVRAKAVYALSRTGVKTDAAFNGLLKAMSDSDESVAETAADELDKFGPPSKKSLPTLTKLTEKGSPEKTRTVALKLLGQMGASAAPVFSKLLKNADALDTIVVIHAIAGLGKEAAPVLPELTAFMVKNRHWDAEAEMLATFKKCGSDGATGLSNVLKGLHDPKSPSFAPDDDRSKIVLKAIGEIGPDAKVAVHTLVHLLDNRSALRPQVLETLGDIGPAAKEAIPAVEALTKDSAVGKLATATLKRLGKIAREP